MHEQVTRRPVRMVGALEHALPGIVGKQVALLHGQQRLRLPGGWQVAGAALPVPPGGNGVIGQGHMTIPLTLSMHSRVI